MSSAFSFQNSQNYQYVTLPPHSLSVFLSIADFFADYQGTSLLYSGGDFDSARHSLLGLFPFETIEIHGRQLDYQMGLKIERKRIENPWNALQDQFFNRLMEDPNATAFGWFGYGMGASADEDHPLPYRPSSLPDAFWQRCAIVLERDHQSGQTIAQINGSVLDAVEMKAKPWVCSFLTFQGWKMFLDALPPSIYRYETRIDSRYLSHCRERRSLYIDKVMQAQELIREGEIYQVNLSHLFQLHSQRPPFSFFRQMCELNPAPFSVYFRHRDATIVSTSPERFLCKRGNRLETRPIKGTIARGKTDEEDLFLKKKLLASSKERAELLMITDLMRNDLGRISEIGSVKTLDLWRCEAYTNVFHLISVIQSIAKPKMSPLEIIRSAFPGGSITGCPKLRAMEIIDELEKRSRGIYTGSIGYIKGQGDFDLNIAIRTLVKNQETYFLQLGSGIVIDSDPNEEYEETMSKGDSLFYSLETEEIICD
ncbi:MAG: anthranilate synthase component I family protein [Parachlamydiaceae bacterium]